MSMTTTTDHRHVDSDGLLRLDEQKSLGTYLADLWRVRDFILTLPASNAHAQHQRSVLGNLWLLLNPLMFAGVYLLVFGVLFGANREIHNYPGFLIVGLFTFLYTSRVANTGTRVVHNNAALIQSISFPRAAMPIATNLSELTTHIPALGAMIVLVALTGETPGVGWLLVVPALALQTIFNLGVALIVARLAFHFYDVSQFIPHVLRLWMYLSGVLYSVDFVSDRTTGVILTLFETNPMYIMVTLFRNALLDGAFVPAVWVAASIWAFGSVTVGLLFFKARELEYGSV